LSVTRTTGPCWSINSDIHCNAPTAAGHEDHQGHKEHEEDHLSL
jgi:hypothetical protein